MYIKTITALAIIAILLLASAAIPNVLADELNASQPIVNGSHVALALENHTYYPNDTVRFYIQGAAEPMASVVDPLNTTYAIPLTVINNTSSLGEYSLSQGIILGNYTVIAADNATGEAVQDSFEVTTRTVGVTPTPVTNNTTVDKTPLYLYINLSKTDYIPGEMAVITVSTNAGTPTVVVKDPVNNTAYPACKKIDNSTYSATYGLDRAIVLGNYTVLAYVNENGAYSSAMAGFNATAGSKIADKGMHIRYAAYDPAQKAIILRANVTANAADAVNIVKNDTAVKGKSLKTVKVIGASNATAGVKEDRVVDVTIPVDNNNASSVVSQYGLDNNITKATTTVAVSADGKNIHLSLNNKVDGSWYRMSASIPAGYTVQKIVRGDGTEIKNDVEFDQLIGEYVKNDINWYLDNGTLYFYDDPANNYSVFLSSSYPAAITLYFHDNAGTCILNTSMSDSNNYYTYIQSNGYVEWDQSPPLASDFIIQSNPTVNLYVNSSSQGTTGIDVSLYCNNTSNLIGYSSITSFRNGGNTPNLKSISIQLIAANTTIPSGSTLIIRIKSDDNNKNTYIWESTQCPSNFSFTSITYINVTNVSVYDASGSMINNTTLPTTVKVVANVTDPFGTQDINNVSMAMYYANGSMALGPLSMSKNYSASPASGAWALYEVSIPLNANQSIGNYTIVVNATSLNGITNNNSTFLLVNSKLIYVTATKSIAYLSGSNFSVNILVTNNLGTTLNNVYAYDFYAADFTVGGFNQSQVHTTISVNNAILQGNINVFGPFTLLPNQSLNITYTAQGKDNYRLSNMTIVGVDPPA